MMTMMEFAEQIKAEVERFLGAGADYERAKQRLTMKLINTEKNEELLKQVPNIPFHDLSIVFYLDLGENGQDHTRRSAQIWNLFLEIWKVTPAQLYQDAKESCPKLLPMVCTEIGEVLHMGPENLFYVLSNQKSINGAGVILYPGCLKECAKKLGGDFYLLPSSVHEMLLLPCDEDKQNVLRLRDIVKQVNRTAVADEEYLSGHVYRYFQERDQVEVVA